MHKDLETGIKSLPPLPESVGKIQNICNNPVAGIGELSAVVEKDPMLTANLLKAANSPLYGFSREINNITQAVSLFGMATVKGFALASAVRTTMKIDLTPYGLSTESFAQTSQMHNALMMHWYKKVNTAMMEVLSPASFLLGVGKIVIAKNIIDSGKDKEFLEKIGNTPTAIEVEQEYFGIDSADVAAAVFDHWRFEPDLVDAIKFSNEKNGEVAVSTYLNENKIKVYVEDNGKGIEKDDLNLIFNKFYQAKNQTILKPIGSGLGLAISKQIIESHKGKIWAENIEPRGARLTFTLPLNNN